MKLFKVLFACLLMFGIFSLSVDSRILKESVSADEIIKKKKRDWNILLVTIDTLRTDRISVYDDRHLQTPYVDGLAARGVVFTRAFAHNPLTLASHVNILTGTTPLFHGISDNAGYKLDSTFFTAAEFVKEKGYATGAFVGAFPLDSRFGLDQGFDVYDDRYGTKSALEFFFVERPAEKVIDPAVAWLEKQRGPWFCWVHVFDPHQPYLPPEPYAERFQHDLYSGEVAYVDDQLGRLFDFLEKNQEMDKTFIILTADHGEGLGDHGEATHSYFAYNSTIHVPLIMFIPGLSKRIISTNVCHVDIFPTICEILGYTPPGHIQGESLIPLINGKERQRPQIYFESMSPFLNRGWAPLKGFVERDLKFIHLPIQEVYDLSLDFQELSNLADSSDLSRLNRILSRLEDGLSNTQAIQRGKRLDRDTLAKLRTLGYISGSTSRQKTQFTEKDDLKILLPYQNDLNEAVSLHEQGQTERAVSLLEQIIENKPRFTIAYTHLATIYRDTGRPKEAVRVLRKGLSDDENNVALMAKLGIILTETGSPQEAAGILTRCTEIEDFNPEYWNYLGIAHYMRGEFRQALESYNRALELDDDYALAHNNIGNIYMVIYLEKNDSSTFDEAVKRFQLAIELDPRLASAYNGLGGAYKKAGRVEDAISLWEKSLELQPGFSFPLYNLGVTYFQRGEKHKALEHLEEYKTRYYATLSQKEKDGLDEMIRRCKSR